MRRVVVLAVLGVLLTAGLMACGSTSGSHCDAYGSIDNVETNSSDLASK